MQLSFTFSRQDTRILHGWFTCWWQFGQCSSFVTTNAMLFCQVSEGISKRVTSTKMHQREEGFHMDGALTWFHVQTIFGKHWAGLCSRYWLEHGLPTCLHWCRFIRWQSGLSRSTKDTSRNLETNTPEVERLSSHSLFDLFNCISCIPKNHWPILFVKITDLCYLFSLFYGRFLKYDSFKWKWCLQCSFIVFTVLQQNDCKKLYKSSNYRRRFIKDEIPLIGIRFKI